MSYVKNIIDNNHHKPIINTLYIKPKSNIITCKPL